jgi:ABC-type branched-subunit amino acid transport system permease subunit
MNMNRAAAFFSGPAGCIASTLLILIWGAFFLTAEDQTSLLLSLLSLVCFCLLAVRLRWEGVLRASMTRHEDLWDICLILIMLALLAIFREDHYNLFLLGTIMAYATAVLGLNVQLGYTGVLNFSSASFFGIGCYTAALLTTGTALPPLLALPLGGIIAALTGCALLLPVLRTSGHYAALVTMAFALLFRVFLDVSEWFGGPQGIPVPPLTIAGLDFSRGIPFGEGELSFYLQYDLLFLLILCLAFSLTRRLERSWIGLALDAVRSDEVASACFGINIQRWKIIAFTLGNFLSGLSGALYAMMLAYISPANFTFADSLLFLSILLLGGIGYIRGVLVSTLLVVIIPEKFQLIQEYRYLIYSALVLLMIVFRPVGLLPRKPRAYSGGPA